MSNSDTIEEKSGYSAEVTKEFLKENTDGVKGQVLHSLISGSDTNPLRNVLVNNLANDIQCSIRSKTVIGTVFIGESLTTDEQVQLQKSYPEFDLKFTASVVNSHGYSAASRKLERKILMSKVSYYPNNANDLSIALKEIGGDIVTSTINGETGIHVCSPILDQYDDTRLNNRRAMARKHLKRGLFKNASTKNVLENYMEVSDYLAPTNEFCFNKSERCNVKCDSMIALHSTYDIPLKSLGDAMDKADAKQLYGSFIFSPQVLTEDKGVIPWINADFNVLRDDYGRRTTINFGFAGCNGFNYAHDYATYISYVSNSMFQSSNGRTYTLELLEQRNGVQFFRATRLTHITGSPIRFRLYLSHLKDQYVVRFPYLHYGKIPDFPGFNNSYIKKPTKSMTFESFWSSLPKNVEWLEFAVCKYIIDRACAYALGNTEEKFKIEHLINFLRSLFSRDPSFTSFAQKHGLLDPKRLIALAMAIYAYLYQLKYVFGKVNQQYILDIHAVRSGLPATKNVLTEFKRNHPGCWDVFLAFAKNPFSPVKPVVLDPNMFICEPADYIDMETRVGPFGRFKTFVVDPVPENINTKIIDNLILTDEINKVVPELALKEKVTPKVKIFVKTPKKNSIFKKLKKYFTKDFDTGETMTIVVNQDKKWSSGKKTKAPSPPTVVEEEKPIEVVNNPDAPPVKPPRKRKSASSVIYAEITKPVCLELVPYTPKETVEEVQYAELDFKPKKTDDFNDTIVTIQTVVDSISALPHDAYISVKKANRKILPPDVINRSQAKLRSLLTKYFPDVTFENVLDLCSAPGGFLLEITKHCSNVDSVVYKDGKIELHPNVSKLNVNFLNYINNDLTDKTVLEMLIQDSRSYNLILADGAVQIDNVFHEDSSYELIKNECAVGISKTKIGGSFIVKMFGFLRPSTRNLVYDLSRYFGEVFVVRDVYTSTLSLEQYVICYKRLPEGGDIRFNGQFNFSLLLAQLLDNLDKMTDTTNDEYVSWSDIVTAEEYPRLGVYVDKSISVDGSRNECCFLAAVEDRDMKPEDLKKILISNYPKNRELREECGAGSFGGRAVLECVSWLYNVKYVVVHNNQTDVIASKPNAYRTIRLKLKDNHYYILPQCSLDYPIQHTRSKMFKPFDYLAAVTKIKTFLSGIVVTDLHAAALKHQGCYYYNNLTRYCSIHKECLNNRIRHVISFLQTAKVTLQIVVCVEKNNFSGAVMDEWLKIYDIVGVRFIDYFNDGYMFMVLHNSNLNKSRTFLKDYNYFLNHKCLKKRRHMYYDFENHFYQFCIDSRKNIIMDEIPDHDMLIKVVYNPSNEYLTKKGRSFIILNGVGNGVHCENIHYLFKALETYCSNSPNLGVVQISSQYSNISSLIVLLQRHSHSLHYVQSAISNDLPLKYYPSTNPTYVMRNAMIEMHYLWSNEMSIVTNKLTAIYKAMVDNHVKGSITNLKIDNSAVLLDLSSSTFAMGMNFNPPYNYGMSNLSVINTENLFDSKGNIIVDNCKMLRRQGHHHIVFTSFSKMIHGVTLSSIYSPLLIQDFNMPVVKYIRGVPGAGKTEYILRNNLKSINNMILTVTREGKNDMQNRAKNMLGFRMNTDRIRTIDSLLLGNTPGYVVEDVWIDEALLVHSGAWFWVALVTHCKTLNIVGDNAQIPYINRDGIETHFSSPDLSIAHEILSVNRRNPLDVVTWLDAGGFYSFPVTGTSSILRSVECRLINGVSEIPKLNGRVYLTFTQADKTTVKMQGLTPVHTIHEYQGSQSDHVILIRLQTKEADSIYKSEPHILVALTRHRQTFTYFTVISDVTYGHCTRIKCYHEGMMKERQNNLRGGSTTHDVIPESAVVLYKESKVLRDIQSRNLHTGYIPTFFLTDFNFDETPAPPRIRTSGGVNEIQTFIDAVLPGSSTEFNQFDHIIFEYSDLDFPNVVTSRMALPNFKKYDYLCASVRSSIQYPLHTSQKLSIKAFLERNGNVPKLQGFVDDYTLANNLVIDLKKLFVRFPDFKEHPIYPNIKSLDVWIRSQPPAIVKCIMADSEFQDQSFTLYDYILKTVPKIDLELNAEFRNKSPQTIAFQKKTINSVYCPLLKDFMDRVIYCLPDQILLYNSMSPQEFAQLMDRVIPLEVRERLNKFMEIDFSKYDKSQGMLILLFEAMIMIEFGIPIEYVKIWVLMHRYTTLLDRINGFSAEVEYQRKSGDAGTWRLNTLVQLAILNTVYRLHELVSLNRCVALLSGDDSVIFLDEEIIDVESKTFLLQTRYNMEAKLMHFKTPYFCSKFLLLTEWGWIFVPDTVKLCVKLGRHDMVDEVHVEMYRISFDDNLYYYKFARYWPYINDAINDRYKSSGDHDYVFKALLNLARSAENFNKLYYEGSDFIKGNVTTRPSIEL